MRPRRLRVNSSRLFSDFTVYHAWNTRSPEKHEKGRPTHNQTRSTLDATFVKFCNFVAFGVFVNTPSRGQTISETAQKCGCDKMCGVDFTLEGQDKGNEVVKPYKIITKGEVVSSVVTGSLHDNFLLLENKGVTALH